MLAILIGGLPGAGKTTLARQMLKDKPNLILFDDLSRYEEPIKAISNLTEDFVITDPFLCREKDRNTLAKEIYILYPGIQISWIMFENEPEKCLSNVALRQDGRRVEKLIEILSRRYSVPEGAKMVDVPFRKQVSHSS